MTIQRTVRTTLQEVTKDKGARVGVMGEAKVIRVTGAGREGEGRGERKWREKDEMRMITRGR